jgi:AcrR family transcriptional regulator
VAARATRSKGPDGRTETDDPYLLSGPFLRRTPRQSRSRALVRALIESLEEYFERGKDVDEVPLESLLDRAGVGIGSFYEYFSNKDGLLGALIAQAMKRNFDELSQALYEAEYESIDKVVAHVARRVSLTYFVRPDRTRFIWVGIMRLGLFPSVLRQRDQFARELAKQAALFVPDEPLEELERTMRTVSDAIIGIVDAGVFRKPPMPPADAARDVELVAMAILRARHPSLA